MATGATETTDPAASAVVIALGKNFDYWLPGQLGFDVSLVACQCVTCYLPLTCWC